MLTDREKRIMDLLLQGKRYHAIGAVLGIKPHSVATAMERICNKLCAETRTQAMAIYVEGRFLSSKGNL